MNFHQLSNLQLLSMLTSRHLNREQIATAQQELDRRGLTAEELDALEKELASREHQSKWTLPINNKVMWLVLAVLFLMVLRQISCT